MITPDDIATVTEALRRRLTAAIAPVAATGLTPGVTALPIDAHLADGSGLNLFLYDIVRDGGRPASPGRRRVPEPRPLALRLRYLLSAHVVSIPGLPAYDHVLLGAAMRALHDRPILDATELGGKAARVTPLRLGTTELSALWTSCGAHRRIAQAYEVVGVDAGARAADRRAARGRRA